MAVDLISKCIRFLDSWQNLFTYPFRKINLEVRTRIKYKASNLRKPIEEKIIWEGFLSDPHKTKGLLLDCNNLYSIRFESNPNRCVNTKYLGIAYYFKFLFHTHTQHTVSLESDSEINWSMIRVIDVNKNHPETSYCSATMFTLLILCEAKYLSLFFSFKETVWFTIFSRALSEAWLCFVWTKLLGNYSILRGFSSLKFNKQLTISSKVKVMFSKRYTCIIMLDFHFVFKGFGLFT